MAVPVRARPSAPSESDFRCYRRNENRQATSRIQTNLCGFFVPPCASWCEKSMSSEIVHNAHPHSPVDLAKLKSGPEKRGFSSMEKWVIWAVFCLLVGLSTRFIIFPALLLISWGVVRFRWYAAEKTSWRQRWPAIVVFLTGAGIVLWSIFY